MLVRTCQDNRKTPSGLKIRACGTTSSSSARKWSCQVPKRRAQRPWPTSSNWRSAPGPFGTPRRSWEFAPDAGPRGPRACFDRGGHRRRRAGSDRPGLSGYNYENTTRYGCHPPQGATVTGPLKTRVFIFHINTAHVYKSNTTRPVGVESVVWCLDLAPPPRRRNSRRRGVSINVFLRSY